MLKTVDNKLTLCYNIVITTTTRSYGMDVIKIIDGLGSTRQAADALGFSQQSVYVTKKRGTISTRAKGSLVYKGLLAPCELSGNTEEAEYLSKFLYLVGHFGSGSKLAKELGVSQAMVNYMIRGKRSSSKILNKVNALYDELTKTPTQL
jgi:predicted transcriptional regulator